MEPIANGQKYPKFSMKESKANTANYILIHLRDIQTKRVVSSCPEISTIFKWSTISSCRAAGSPSCVCSFIAKKAKDGPC